MANYNPGFKGTTEGLLRGAATSAAKRSAAYKMSDAEFKEFKKLAESLKERGFYVDVSRNPTGNVTLRLTVNDALGGFRSSYPPNKQSLETIKNKITEVKKQPNYAKFAEVKRGVPEKIKRQTQLSLEKARDPSRIEAEIRRLKKGLMPNHQLHHLAGKDELTKLNNLKFLPTNLNTADDIIRAEQNIIDLNKETNLILDQAKISKNDKIRLNQLNALKKRIKNKDLKGQLKGLKSMDIISFDKDGNVIKKSVGADIKMKTTGAGTEVGEIAFSDIVSKTDPRRLDVLNMATAEIAKEIEGSGDKALIKTFHQRLKKAGLRISCKDGCIVKAADSNPATLRKVVQEVTKEQPQKMIRLFRGESFPQRNIKGFKDKAKFFKTTIPEIKKDTLSGQWFTPNQAHAKAYLSRPGQMKYVDVTPAELESFNRYKAKVNKRPVKYSVKKMQGLPDAPTHGVTTSPHHQVIPRYKLKQMEEAGRIKSKLDLNPFGKSYMSDVLVKPAKGVLEYDLVLGGFVDSANPGEIVGQNQLKTWAADNPMDVKVGTEIPKPNKSVLKTVGKTLAHIGAPLPTALIDGYFINKQVDEGKSTAEIAKDPLNWLGLATMEPLTKMAGANAPGGLNAVLRLGLNPATIRGITRFAGLPGLAISTAMTAYDQYKKYQNEEGFVYNLFNKEGT